MGNRKSIVACEEDTIIYDKETIVEGCTVQILENEATGKISVGWWKGSKEDMPGMKKMVIEGVRIKS